LAGKKSAELFSRAQFTPEEVSNLRQQFVKLDFDHDDKITRQDLVKAMTDMGYQASSEVADGILHEVDFGGKGAVEFQEYLDVSLGLCVVFPDSVRAMG